MRKFTLNFKTLLVAAGLVLGSVSAWGYEVPTGYEIKTVYVGTNKGDGTVTADAFDYESVPTAWVAQDDCALSIGTKTLVENAAVGSVPASQPTYVDGKSLCTTVSGTSWTYHWGRYTMENAVSSGYLVFRADMYCASSPTYIRFLDADGNEVLKLGFANGDGNKYYQYTVNGGSANNCDMNTTYRSYHGFSIEDLVINMSTGAVTFYLDYINTNDGNKRVQVTCTKNINIGTGKSIKYIELGSVVNGSQTVYYDNIKYYHVGPQVNSLKVKYTLNGTEILSESLSTTGLCTDASYTVPFRMYIQKDGKLYKTTKEDSDPYYGKSVTLTAETVLERPVTEVDLNGGTIELFEDLDDTDGDNADKRASNRSAYGNKSYTSPSELSAGYYTFYLKLQNKGRGSKIMVGSTEVYNISKSSKGAWEDVTLNNVYIPSAGNLTFTKGGSKTIDYYDIIIAVKNSGVPATITEAGWATLYTPYALDFSTLSGSLTAYTATYANGTVTLSPVSNVPANTGVVLKGAEGSYSIPVTTSSSTPQGNLTGSATAATSCPASSGTYYILALNGNNEAQFFPATSGSIAAGKAYLSVPESAGVLNIVFDEEGEATGIAAPEVVDAEEDGVIYNLSGQVVTEDYKGIVIKNGKKYLNK